MAQGIDYNYVRFDTSTPQFRGLLIPELLNLAKSEGFIGINVTPSFKMEVLQFLDELSPEAQILGAVNADVFRNGRRFGHNTECSGFQTVFQNEMANATKTHFLLLGSGGGSIFN